MFSCNTSGYEVGTKVAYSSGNRRRSYRETLGRGDRIEEARHTNWS